MSYITVKLEDFEHITNPKIDKLVEFKVEGPATIVGIGNGNPTNIQSFQANQQTTWKGRCLLIIKSKNEAGRIIIKAKSDKIKLSVLELSSK